MSPQFAPDVLLIEDNPGDVRLFEIAFAEADVPGTLHVATDGGEARSALWEGARSGPSSPVDMIILDLDLPETQGTGLLREIRNDASLDSVPVLVLSTSEDPAVIEEAYALGANAYLTKRTDFEGTLGMVETLYRFWFEVVERPAV